ncbi:hypothetical protein HAALTHF_29030n [Vreelandella aquamarina]|nr:hypothetical protein HAALTHF_29030n [Halomonas axialensis]
MRMYREQLKGFAPLPVVMRTLDIGGDKDLPYFPIEEANPFLGWRGMRVTLDHPEVLMVQLRAMLKASHDLGNLYVLFPMITNVEEVDEAIRLLDRAILELGEESIAVERPKVGVMIEVPATIYQMDALAKRVDFFSVGSNDLTQYLLAVDRNNPRVSSLYDALHPALLGALQELAQDAKRLNKPISLCGELAGDPAGALLLMAMGFTSLSMNAPACQKCVPRFVGSRWPMRKRCSKRSCGWIRPHWSMSILINGWMSGSCRTYCPLVINKLLSLA